MADTKQSFGVVVHGVDSVYARLGTMTEALAVTLRAATETVARMVEAEAKKNATGPARWVDGVKHPREGGPGNVSGTLRSSITASHVSGSGLSVTARVGPTAVYGRAIEFGHPRWKRGKGYPYMTPAYEKVLPKVRPIFGAAISQAMRG